MRNVIIALTLLVASNASFADSCMKVLDQNAQRSCVIKNIQERNKEMERLQMAIMQSPNVPEKDKRIFYKDQSEWIDSMNSICDAQPYCMNSELEQRVNNLSAYYASFAKRK